jgi:hypothetical protein
MRDIISNYSAAPNTNYASKEFKDFLDLFTENFLND